MPPEVPDPETIDKQVDRVVMRVTASQSDALVAGITAYYKAGSDDARPSTRLTNVQKNAIKKLSAEHFGYISEFNHNVAEQIKDKAKDLLKQEKGYADISKEVKDYAEKVFEGTEKIVIDNTGKTRTIVEVGKDGTLRKAEKIITRPYVTNVQAYSDMLARTATHTAWEQGRASEYQRMGFNKWRFAGPADERGRDYHIAVLGNVYEYGTEQSDLALQLLSEPNCRHRAIVFFDDPELDTPQEFFDKQKDDAGLQWVDNKGWTFTGAPEPPKKKLAIPKQKKTPEKASTIKYTPADDIKDAEKWAMDNTPVQNVDYKGLDIRTANAMNESLARHFNLEPDLANNIRYYGTIQGQNKLAYQLDLDKAVKKYKEVFGGTDEEALEFAKRRVKKKVAPSHTYAWSWKRKDEASGIAINKKYGKDFDEFVAKTQADVAAGFHPIGCDSPKAIIDHEFGHALDDVHEYYKQDKITEFFVAKNAGDIGNELSRYAMTNKRELIAEAWSEYNNNPSPRPIAVAFGDWMKAQTKG